VSKNSHKHRLSLKGDHSAQPTAPIEQAQVATSAPIQEQTMPEVQEQTQEQQPEASEEQIGPTAKQMAAAEETNQMRLRAQAAQDDKPPPEAPVNIVEVAARGYDALQEAFAKHNAIKPKAYVPPPRTERQMAALQEELDAGRKAGERAAAQQASRPQPKSDQTKDGFTTPAYRPNNLVPDPTIPATSGHVAGTREYGADA
jgi:hypothetical protein